MHVCLLFICSSIFCFKMRRERFFSLGVWGWRWLPWMLIFRPQSLATVLEVWKYVQHRFMWQAWLKSVAEQKLPK